MRKTLIFIFLFCSFLSANSNRIPQLSQKVSVQLNWKFQYEFAGFIVALEKGYYKDAGFDVELLENPGNIKSYITLLNNNEVDFVVTNEDYIELRNNGNDVVFLANYFKESPYVFLTKPYIVHPKDMENKIIMGEISNIHGSALEYMLKQTGVDDTTFKRRPNTFNIDDFVNDKIEVMEIYTTNELHTIYEKNIPHHILDPKDYGFSKGVTNLATTQKIIDRIGYDKIKKFIDATNKGWRYAFDNQDEVVELILAKYNTSLKKSKDALVFEAVGTKKLFLLDRYDIGEIDKNELYRWVAIFQNFGTQIDERKFDGFVFGQKWRDIVYSKEKVVMLGVIYILVAIVFFVLIFLYFSKKQKKALSQKNTEMMEQNLKIRTILDSQKNFIIITNSISTKFINKQMLNFFGYQSLTDFNANHSCICEFFVEDHGYLSKEYANLNWIEYIATNQHLTHQAKIKDLNGEPRIFQVDANKIAFDNVFMSNEYVITFTDITKLHIQTKLLMQKSKNAALGEMVASIAHQWRQPLGSLALLIQNIEDDYDEQLVDRQYLQNFIDKNMKLINYLSQTIDDFRNFFKPDNELTKFSIKKVIENICSIQKPQLLKYQIDVQIIGNDFVVDGFENEFGQVVINLINNSTRFMQ